MGNKINTCIQIKNFLTDAAFFSIPMRLFMEMLLGLCIVALNEISNNFKNERRYMFTSSFWDNLSLAMAIFFLAILTIAFILAVIVACICAFLVKHTKMPSMLSELTSGLKESKWRIILTNVWFFMIRFMIAFLTVELAPIMPAAYLCLIWTLIMVLNVGVTCCWTFISKVTKVG
jgi:hypothetical protein